MKILLSHVYYVCTKMCILFENMYGRISMYGTRFLYLLSKRKDFRFASFDGIKKKK